jgi:hypothetical protein
MVRNHGSGGEPVEQWRRADGRLVIRAFNEGGFSCTDVDLFDLVDWLRTGAGRILVLDNGKSPVRDGGGILGN